MISWLEKMILHRRASAFFPDRLLCNREIARTRFRKALTAAREIYSVLRSDSAHRDFVHSAWTENIQSVETYFLEEFDMSFLDNPVINGTMVFTDRAVHKEEWARLQRWRDPGVLVKYIGSGLNEDFLSGRQKSASALNSIHQLYHLSRFEAFTGKKIERITSVVEFGGGYGNLARLFDNFGSLSRFIIIDLSLFSCIQYVFLSSVLGAEKVVLIDGPGKQIEEGKVNLVPIPFLDGVHPGGDLFLSTWALSESTHQAYTYVTGKKWFEAPLVLLAHNEKWKPWVDEALMKNLEEGGREVAIEPFPFLAGNRYVFARKTTA